VADKVNLDALIQREDFEVKSEAEKGQVTSTIKITDLKESEFFYSVLRKPDFQRETSEWTPDKIQGFIASFVNGDLIPAVILWSEGGSQVFVIDGSHRLSALIAWVNDDYGDGFISNKFFEYNVSEEQKKTAEKTRRVVKKEIGTYQEHLAAIRDTTGKVDPDLLNRSKRLARLAIQLQWVPGNAEKAEDSFFKINQQAAPIDKTELRLLKARNKPNAIAARAILRAGTGHKYWSKFESQLKDEIEKKAREINELLFVPALQTPIKTLDLPVAGKGYSAKTLSLVFDLVNLSNSNKKDDDYDEDVNGETTLKLLTKTLKVVRRISGMHASSLGLHPAVYFYSARGRYQPTAFLAVIALLLDFELQEWFLEFSKIRRRFEEFILKYKDVINQVTNKLGSGVKGYRRIEGLLWEILKLLKDDKSEAAIIETLGSNKDYDFLTFKADLGFLSSGTSFNSETKSAVFIRDALKAPVRCSICSGLMHVKSITVDHKERKRSGGKGTVENGQLSHPYCNSTVKN